jgi:hypothetical protein
MSAHQVNIKNANIRKFIVDTFNNEEFEIFCGDYFQAALAELSPSSPLRVQAQNLIWYCLKRGIIDELLAALQKERPESFRKRFTQPAGTSPVTVQHAISDVLAGIRLPVRRWLPSFSRPAPIRQFQYTLQREQVRSEPQDAQRLLNVLEQFAASIYEHEHKTFTDYTDFGGSEAFDWDDHLRVRVQQPPHPITFIRIPTFASIDDTMVMWSVLYQDATIFIEDDWEVTYDISDDREVRYDGNIVNLTMKNQKLNSEYGTVPICVVPSSISLISHVMFLLDQQYTMDTYRPPQLLQCTDTRSILYPSTHLPLGEFTFLQPLELPIFKGISPSIVQEIRLKETDAFRVFSAHLRRILIKLSTAEDSIDASDAIDELREEVEKVGLIANKVKRLRVLRDASLIPLGLTIGALLFSGGFPASATSLVGSLSLYSVLQSITLGAECELRQNSFYIPYLIQEKSKVKQ